MRLKLPIGIQTFETIRTEGCVYIDKTKYLINLIEKGHIYFLARPRRFGKSLAVSTFNAIFSGRKDLFKGLYAEEFLNRPDFKTSPVISLNMSRITTNQGIDMMELSLRRLTVEIASRFNIEIPEHISSGDILSSLIINTAKKYNQKVVILLDEYDNPYTDFVNEPEMAEKVRNLLRNYYVQIKANDEFIRFTFITGISKFAKLGVFSTLNTPLDISLMPEYADICGLTETEIIQNFPDYLDDTAKTMNITTDELITKMRNYYNGFSFDLYAQSRLYNPYSTLTFFAKKSFTNHWMDTGRSKVISDYLKNRYLTVEQFRNYPISVDFAANPGDVDTAPPEGFLYQGGYLTLRQGTTDALSLDYPNTEVLNSMSTLLAQNILKDQDDDFTFCRMGLLNGLMSSDCEKVIAVLNRLLASIPYDDFSKAAQQSVYYNEFEIKPQEWLYRSTILAFLRGCGVLVFPEIHSNLGRSDLMLSHKGKTWVIELKVAYAGESPAQKAEEALRQIIDKNYATQYPDAVCMGLAIDDAQRQITEIRTMNKE